MLALATATRHPGIAIAIAIAHINFPNEQAVPAAVVIYLVVSAVLSVPYLAWRKNSSRVGDPRSAANMAK